MFHSFYSQLSIIALVLCCGFAVWKGDLAERAGALLIVTTWVITLVASAATKSYMPATAFLASDGIMAIGLLILAIRYSSLWMGLAMLVQATALSFHAAYFAADPDEISKKVLHFYVMGKNLASVGLLVIILAATVTSILKRHRRQVRSTKSRSIDLAAASTAG